MPRFSFKSRKPSVVTLGDRARDAGQWELAARFYRKALDRNPGNPPIWVQYGHVLKESGRLAEAETAYRRAIACDPRVADPHLHLGHVLKVQGKRGDAQAAYMRAFALDPSQTDAMSELRQLGWSDTELKGAVGPDALLASSQTDGASRKRRKASVITLADRARDAGQWELAARLYRNALARNPRNPPIWVQYGHVLKESGELVQAETAYRRAIAHDPGRADPHLHLGHVLKMQGNQEEGEASYLRAFAFEPASPEPLVGLRTIGWTDTQVLELTTMVGSEAGNASASSSGVGHERVRQVFSTTEARQATTTALPQDRSAQGGPTSPSINSLAATTPQDGTASRSERTGGPAVMPPSSRPTRNRRGRADALPLVEAEQRIRTIRESGLFDAAYYRANNPDLPVEVDAVKHFLELGAW
jgi:Tfp pilus assembly protein PilF